MLVGVVVVVAVAVVVWRGGGGCLLVCYQLELSFHSSVSHLSHVTLGSSSHLNEHSNISFVIVQLRIVLSP